VAVLAHPELTGPRSVQQAVEQVRAAQPDRTSGSRPFLVTVTLSLSIGDQSLTAGESRSIWLVRPKDGQMAEMWTYRSNTP
jgi:hypothetical protein